MVFGSDAARCIRIWPHVSQIFVTRRRPRMPGCRCEHPKDGDAVRGLPPSASVVFIIRDRCFCQEARGHGPFPFPLHCCFSFVSGREK